VVFVIWIGEVMLTQGDQQLAIFFFWEEHLFLGPTRSNEQSFFLLQKWNTWHALMQQRRFCHLEGF
jgi:hypothetical protein